MATVLAPLKFVFYGGPENAPEPATTVILDGGVKNYRCLSHWPGYAGFTPPEIKADLTTGIALNFVKLSSKRQLELVGDFDKVSNNHVDADGLFSVFTMLRPDLALAREQQLLEAAATGDFDDWRGPEALARVLTVDGIYAHPASPLAPHRTRLGSDSSAFQALAYDWMLDNFVSMFDDPWQYQELWKGQFDRVVADVGRVDARRDLEVEDFPEFDLAVVSTDGVPLDLVALCHAADKRNRVLLVQKCGKGAKYRFVYRSESWFSLVEDRFPPRSDLQPAVVALNRMEGELGGEGFWRASATSKPTPHLTYSRDKDPANMGNEEISYLPPAAVVEAVKEAVGKVDSLVKSR